MRAVPSGIHTVLGTILLKIRLPPMALNRDVLSPQLWDKRQGLVVRSQVGDLASYSLPWGSRLSSGRRSSTPMGHCRDHPGHFHTGPVSFSRDCLFRLTRDVRVPVAVRRIPLSRCSPRVRSYRNGWGHHHPTLHERKHPPNGLYFIEQPFVSPTQMGYNTGTNVRVFT